MTSPEEELIPILQQMKAFHLKWIMLNEKCQTLQSSLTEANSEKEELEIKLARCTEQIAEKEEENKKLISIIKKLRRKLMSGSVRNLINALKQNIRVYDETVLPAVSELTKDVTSNSDSDISSNEDENEPELLSFVDGNASKLVDQIQNYRSKVIVGLENKNETITKNTPNISITSVPKTLLKPAASSKSPVPIRAGNDKKISIADSSNDSKISSSCVSSTSLARNNTSAAKNNTGIDLLAIPELNIDNIPKPAEKIKQPCFIYESNIESLCIVVEQSVEEVGFVVNTDILPESSLISSSNQKLVGREITNQENGDEKPDVLSPPMLVTSVSKIDDISCKIIDVEKGDPKPNRTDKLKRACSSFSIFESGSKRSAIEKSDSSCSKTLSFSGSADSNTDV